MLVGLSVGLSIGLSVYHLLFRRFRRFASGFRITAPAQSHATDAVMYPAPSTAPALTLPLLPNPRDLCRFVYPALFLRNGLIRMLSIKIVQYLKYGVLIRISMFFRISFCRMLLLFLMEKGSVSYLFSEKSYY